jgi:hypothetical protein
MSLPVSLLLGFHDFLARNEILLGEDLVDPEVTVRVAVPKYVFTQSKRN